MSTAHYKDWTDLDEEPLQDSRWNVIKQAIKIGMLVLLWIFFTYFLIVSPIDKLDTSVVTALPKETLVRTMKLGIGAVKIFLKGPIDADMTEDEEENVAVVGVRMKWMDSLTNGTIEHTPIWNVYLNEKEPDTFATVSKIFRSPGSDYSGVYGLISLENKCEFPVALLMQINSTPMYYGLFYSVLMILGLYVLMCFELTDPTLSVLLMATTGLGILAAMGQRPSLLFITYWVELKVVILMLSFMIISGITSESGLFDWMAVQIYRISKGHSWLTLFFLAIVTAVLSSVIPNVTTVSLMSPVAVLLCEVISAQAPLVIFVVIFYANIGGALTLISDPLNMYIGANTNVDFKDFTIYMLPGVLCGIFVGMPVIYLTMRGNLHRLPEHQIKVTAHRAATRLLLTHEVAELEAFLRKSQPVKPCLRPSIKYFETLAYLKIHYGIRDKSVLAKSLIVVLFVQISFLLHALPNGPGSLQNRALLGATLLVILTKLKDLEHVWNYLDWSILIFVGAHFVFIAVVHELGLTHWLGHTAVKVISSVERDHQTTVAILLVIWLTGFISVLVNNIAVTEVLVGLIRDLSENVNIPLSPLVWALAYGACFGANGSLMGAHANLMGVVVARRFGYHITFLQFFRYGFPVMLASLTFASAYLLIAHLTHIF